MTTGKEVTDQQERQIVAWICPVCHDVITAGIEGEPIGDYRFIVETGHWHAEANHPAVATRLYPASHPAVLSNSEINLICTSRVPMTEKELREWHALQDRLKTWAEADR